LIKANARHSRQLSEQPPKAHVASRQKAFLVGTTKKFANAAKTDKFAKSENAEERN